MNLVNYIILLSLLVGLSSCQMEKKIHLNTPKLDVTVTTGLDVDHVNIWVNNPIKAKEKLNDIGFTSVPDSLSQIHEGQGTSGRYFYFLNAYLELIFVHDKKELVKNSQKNKKLDFVERASFKENGASPFSMALKMKDYNTEKIPFEKVRYHQDWMKEDAYIYAASNSKLNLEEPSIFVVYPEIESDSFATMSDLKKIPEEYSFVRDFYNHPNGAQKITRIKITSTDLNEETKTMKAINKIENVTVQKGKEHLMELYFDNQLQKKSFDLRPELPLIIYL